VDTKNSEVILADNTISKCGTIESSKQENQDVTLMRVHKAPNRVVQPPDLIKLSIAFPDEAIDFCEEEEDKERYSVLECL